jgi:hypothetical protein
MSGITLQTFEWKSFEVNVLIYSNLILIRMQFLKALRREKDFAKR